MARRLSKLAFFTLAAYWLLLFVLTHLPSVHVESHIQYGDKLAHFFAYAALAWLAAMALRVWHFPLPGILLVVLLGGAAYGALDEYLQSFTRRQPDVYDWIADVSGVVFGLIVFLVTHRVLRRLYYKWQTRSPA